MSRRQWYGLLKPAARFDAPSMTFTHAMLDSVVSLNIQYVR